MSKRKHKKRNNNSGNENQNNVNNRNQFNNNPFGINPNQLLSMFGNIDMSQISNMLQSMNTQGFDLNNLNLGPLQDIMGGIPNRNMQQNNMTQNDVANNIPNTSYEKSEDNYNSNGSDPNIEMLIALRNIVDEERAVFVDKIIQHYNKGTFDE